MIDSAIIKTEPGTVDREDVSQFRRLRDSYIAALSPHTRRAYDRDLRDLADFLGERDPVSALRRLLQVGQAEANILLHEYKAALIGRQRAPGTINRRLSTIRSAVRLARLAGLVSWTVEVKNLESRPYRDTRGPGRVGYQRLLAGLNGSTRRREIRDAAILHLLYDLALRRGEVARLDLGDVDPEAGTVRVLGKGRREPETLTLPVETARALARWIERRGGDPGPLFVNFDRAGKGGADRRLTTDSIFRMVRSRAARLGIRTRPHGLRHAAITEALELTGGNLAAVREFARHKTYETLRFYDDNRQNRGGEVARLVAAAAGV